MPFGDRKIDAYFAALELELIEKATSPLPPRLARMRQRVSGEMFV
jgi:hypothetical protein